MATASVSAWRVCSVPGERERQSGCLGCLRVAVQSAAQEVEHRVEGASDEDQVGAGAASQYLGAGVDESLKKLRVQFRRRGNH
jgi:hypothetical protein